MEFRFSILIKALLVFACILGGCEYLSQLDNLKAELAELKAQAGPLRETEDLRRQEWTKLKAAKDKLDQLMQHEAKLHKQRDLLDTQERKLTGEIKYLAGSMTAAVEKARSSAIGTVFPELKLPGHPTLHNAKIFKINDDSISFLHEDGAANLHVKAEELPVELVQKYDLGLKSIHKALLRLKGDLEAPGPAK
jgi:hypothetical protein